MKANIAISQDKITDFCRRWNITELALFGSALRPDFRPDSDVDVLVQFDQVVEYTLFDLVHMQDELRMIFDREVDLVEKSAIERSRNYLRRKAILGTAEVLYAA